MIHNFMTLKLNEYELLMIENVNQDTLFDETEFIPGSELSDQSFFVLSSTQAVGVLEVRPTFM